MDENEKYLFDVQGFLILEDVLTADEVSRLIQGIPRDGDGAIVTDEDGRTFSGFLGYGEPLFRELINHPRILPYLTELLAEKNQDLPWKNRFYLSHEHGMLFKKGAEGLWLHNGGSPYDAWLGYRVQEGQIFCHLTNVVWALTDAYEGDGGFTCIPGSHKAQFALPEPIEKHAWKPDCVIQPRLRAGSAIIFTEALTHGTRPWSAEHDRIVLFYKYVPGHMPLVHPDLQQHAHLLTQEQRQYITP